MVIRFPLRKKLFGIEEDARLESHPSRTAAGDGMAFLTRTAARGLSRREIEHRKRMLQHLQQLRT
jgi:hypothetical protein